MGGGGLKTGRVGSALHVPPDKEHPLDRPPDHIGGSVVAR